MKKVLFLNTMMVLALYSQARAGNDPGAGEQSVELTTIRLNAREVGDFSLSGLSVSPDGKTAVIKTGTFESSYSLYDIVPDYNKGAGHFWLKPRTVNDPSWRSGPRLFLTLESPGKTQNLSEGLMLDGQKITIAENDSLGKVVAQGEGGAGKFRKLAIEIPSIGTRQASSDARINRLKAQMDNAGKGE
jgi:hypothetical protein